MYPLYHFTISSPQNIAIKVPTTKNGPKGMALFKAFFFINMKIIPQIAPRVKANNKATKILGQPSIKPMRNASFASPPPMPSPFVAKIMLKKKTLDTIAAKIKLII